MDGQTDLSLSKRVSTGILFDIKRLFCENIFLGYLEIVLVLFEKMPIICFPFLTLISFEEKKRVVVVVDENSEREEKRLDFQLSIPGHLIYLVRKEF